MASAHCPADELAEAHARGEDADIDQAREFFRQGRRARDDGRPAHQCDAVSSLSTDL